MKKILFGLALLLHSVVSFSQYNHDLLDPVTPPSFFRDYALFAYDFTNLTGADGATISNGNAGLEDLSNNNRDATIIGTPLVEQLTVNGTTINTFEDLSTNALSIGVNGSKIFNRNAYRIYMVVYVTDGQPAATHNLLGGIVPTNQGVNLFLATTGIIGFQIGNGGQVSQWRTATAFENGINGLVIIEVQVDLNTDDVLIKLNGENTGTFQFSGDLSAISTTSWTNTQNIYIGSLNNNGTAATNATSNSILFCAVTPYYLGDDLDQEIDDYLYTRFFKWENEIHVTDESSANSLRSILITEVFNGSGLPAGGLTLQTAGYSGAMHICNTSNITGESSIDKYTVSTTDADAATWTYKGYLMHTSATPLNILIINIQGHISDNVSAHESYMSQALAAGYDVYYCALPVGSNDNTETNSTITLQSTAGHDQIKSGGLDDGTYNALELFLYDKIVAINEFENDYDAIYLNGISGGGWCTTMVSAIDTRISKAVAVRGYMPRTFKDVVINREGDYEQMGALFAATSLRTSTQVFNLGTSVSYMDLVAMATTGGRRYHSTNHRNDDCCFKGLTYRTWTPAITELTSAWGGDFQHFTDTDVSRLTHAYSVFDIDVIFDAFDNP